jgi:hypothetical protein
MNKRIKLLIERAEYQAKKQSGYEDWEVYVPLDPQVVFEKFAELIVRECMKEAWEEIVDDEDIAAETDPQIREYLTGQNQGIVDAVIRFRNHFGVEE